MNFNNWFERVWNVWPRDLCKDPGDKQAAYNAAKKSISTLEQANDIWCILVEQIKYKRKLLEKGKDGYRFTSVANYFNKKKWTEKVGSFSTIDMEPVTKLNGHAPFKRIKWEPDKDLGKEKLSDIKRLLGA